MEWLSYQGIWRKITIWEANYQININCEGLFIEKDYFEVCFEIPVMATHKEILNYLKLSVHIETEPDKEVQDHIGDTVLGTPGRIRYRHTSLEEKLPYLGKIFFLNLRKSGKLMGTIAFCHRTTWASDRSLRSWHIRYFSIRAPFREAPNRKKRKQKQEKPRRDNILKSTAEPFFVNPDRIARGMKFDSDRSFIYAYIEKKNLRSWNFSESVGFETIGQIHTSLYSRFRPRMNPHVQPVPPEDRDFVKTRLREFYKGYIMYTEQHIFFNDHYLVWRENGRIMAGCQANPELWQIIHIPGFLSSIFLKGLARLPFISRRFNPGYMKFVAFEGIWYERGYEHCLLPLIESALALHRMYLGILWLDSSSHVLELSRRLGNRGMVGRFFNAIPGDIRVRFINWDEKEKEEFRNRPCYISCFDVT